MRIQQPYNMVQTARNILSNFLSLECVIFPHVTVSQPYMTLVHFYWVICLVYQDSRSVRVLITHFLKIAKSLINELIS